MNNSVPQSNLDMQRIGTVVIGGGQAGLATGYYLQRMDEEFVILEGDDRLGDSWRRRWDSTARPNQ